MTPKYLSIAAFIIALQAHVLCVSGSSTQLRGGVRGSALNLDTEEEEQQTSTTGDNSKDKTPDPYDHPTFIHKDVMGDKCREIIRGNQWSYKVTDATYKEIDVDGDSTMSPGDMTTFTNGVVNVFGRRDGAVVATGSIDGTCTVLPTDSIDREFCQVTFNFGAAGTVSARGPLEQMNIISTTGCFFEYYGAFRGALAGTEFSFEFVQDKMRQKR